jgi:formate hydrogenlyase transcriptional activator
VNAAAAHRTENVVEVESIPNEIKLLRGCIGDLLSVLALPEIWSGHGSLRLATTCLDAVVRVLSLDFAYLRIGGSTEGSDTEFARQSKSCHQEVSPRDIGRTIEPYLGRDSSRAGVVMPHPVGEGVVSIATFRLGIEDSRNVLVVGSRRASFPTALERLVLQVVANQAALGLQEARHAAQQRSAAVELEDRVAERTAQLTVVNEALHKEVLDRTRAEARVRQDERELRLLVDLVPQIIGAVAPDGTVLQMNRTALAYLGMTGEEIRTTRMPDTRIVHGDDLGSMRVAMNGVLTDGRGHEFEARMCRHDGQYRWFRIRYEPLLDEEGRVFRLYVSGVDIEDRKRAEEQIRGENVALREEIDKVAMFEEIVGTSVALRVVLAYISKVAPVSSTVLITGETGTGKELVARAIHKRSTRCARAFVSVNCAAIPPALVASELFGHEKGSFTGALQRKMGRFELAQGGTIFLDEIGELPAETQIALLRVLQEREFDRVGGTRSIPTDVRVVAATNRDLEKAVAAGTFRADLFYRLNVFPVEMPSLRERREDISLLVEYFVDRYSRHAGKKITRVCKKSLALLKAYAWPGNIRELQNVIERSVILTESDILTVDERWLVTRPAATESAKRPFATQLSAQEKAMIEAALTQTQGRVSGVSGAAVRLQMPPSTLESRIRSLGIDKHRFRPV